MTPESALEALRAGADPARAAEMAAYHRTGRLCLGVPVPAVADHVAGWRAALDLPGRVALAEGLWRSDVHEARVAAAKLLTQARIADDGPVWRLLASWVPEFDGWAIADHVAAAGERRLAADPSRLDEVETWTTRPHMWARRAAMTFTLHLAKMNHPGPEDRARRERVLGWAEGYVADRDWFIQKSVSWWLRTLSKRDPARVRAFLDAHGDRMKAFARKDAGRLLP